MVGGIERQHHAPHDDRRTSAASAIGPVSRVSPDRKHVIPLNVPHVGSYGWL